MNVYTNLNLISFYGNWDPKDCSSSQTKPKLMNTSWIKNNNIKTCHNLQRKAENSIILDKAGSQSFLNSTCRLWPLNITASFSSVHANLPSRVMSGSKLPIWWYFYRIYQKNDYPLSFCFGNRESFLMGWCQIEHYLNNEFKHTRNAARPWTGCSQGHLTPSHLAWEETYVIGSKLQCFVNKILTEGSMTFYKKGVFYYKDLIL